VRLDSSELRHLAGARTAPISDYPMHVEGYRQIVYVAKARRGPAVFDCSVLRSGQPDLLRDLLLGEPPRDPDRLQLGDEGFVWVRA
jgi:hypothetical protein